MLLFLELGTIWSLFKEYQSEAEISYSTRKMVAIITGKKTFDFGCENLWLLHSVKVLVLKYGVLTCC